MSIQVKNLTRMYGPQAAVNDVSFSIGEGEITGFLGPNGAGKSTTMKVITGFIPPTSGKIIVRGTDVEENPVAVKRMTGYLPENNPLYPDMYVHEYLSFVAGLYGLKGNKRKERISEMIALCGLTIEQNKKIGVLSKGYRQRVGLAQALIHDPPVLILDEPTSGLDPNQLVEIRKLIKMVSQNKTVLFSTHILQEAQALCDRVVVINEGKIVADDKLENIMKGGAHQFIVEFANEIGEEVLQQMEGVESVQRIEGSRFRIKAQPGVDARSKLVSFAAQQNLSLIELKQDENSLESIFSRLTQK